MRATSRFCLIVLSAVVAYGCGASGRVLVVKSEPADAEVCIKGKAKSEHFSNNKSCVGTTPFEADRVEVASPGGDKETVKFKDVEADKESFYVVVSRPGYATQALEVPGWEHYVQLKPEGAAALPAAPSSIAQTPVTPNVTPPPPAEKGSVRITSEPVGALVYLNDVLKGNTPFTYEGNAGPLRLKLELEGYNTLEKVVTVEGNNNISVNFKMLSNKAAEKEARKAGAIETTPVKIEDEKPPKPEPKKAEKKEDELPPIEEGFKTSN